MMESRSASPKRYSQTEKAGLAPAWPMSVGQFLDGSNLERADVMLTRRHGSLFSSLIRWATKSHFSHSALVFLVPHREKEFNHTFVIEAGTKGVDLTNLEDYVNDRAQAVAIKRHRTADDVERQSGRWFDERVQKRVRARMLNKIKSKYNFGTIFAIAFDIADRMLFGVNERMRGRRKALEIRRKRNMSPPNEFICSGLVQLGFIESVAELINEGVVPPTAMKQVVFIKEIADFLPDDYDAFTPAEIKEMFELFVDVWREELEAIKPVDLARSENLEWRYVIFDGWVHRVNSLEEAYDLLSWEAELYDDPIGA